MHDRTGLHPLTPFIAIKMLCLSVVRQMLPRHEQHTRVDSRTAEEQACEWIARLNADDVHPRDCEQLDAWLAQSPINARAFNEVMSTWLELTACSDRSHEPGELQLQTSRL
jgi:ferric-dicitrate binding protein FerR (iron transport regulator)